MKSCDGSSLAPVKRLNEAAGSPDAAIRAAVAANLACPPAVQCNLVQSPEWCVRWELARNEKAAPDAPSKNSILFVLPDTL